MNLTFFAGGFYWGAWSMPWYAACLPRLWYLTPGSKRRRPSFFYGGLLPTSFLGLGLLAPPLLAYGGLPGLLGPFTTVEEAGQVVAEQAETESPDAFPGVACAGADPLAIPAQRTRATAAPRPGSKTGVAMALRRSRGKDTEPGRRNQAAPEISTDAFSDAAIRGLVDDWLIPMIVEDIIKGRTGGGRVPDPKLTEWSFYAHNYSSERDRPDGRKDDSRETAEARSTTADAASTTDVDPGGGQDAAAVLQPAWLERQ